MSQFITISLGLMLSLSAFAQDLSIHGFKKRFSLVKDTDGKVTLIKLNKATTKFSIMPFIEQIKHDLKGEQESFNSLSVSEKEAQIDEMLNDMGYDLSAKDQTSQEARKIKESLLNIPNIQVDDAFAELDKGDFWKEFERRINEAFLFIDPTVVANLNDARFFYRRQVTYKVVAWALDQAAKRFSNLPILNIASFVIVRVHDMMLEQRHFHHNMLLHYFETISETELGMTKEEVDRAVSSIYEYRIDATDIFSSNAAARDWLNFGMNRFYIQVRAGNTKIRTWKSPFSDFYFEDIKKLNFAFADVNHKGTRKIYHLHNTSHQFSANPALAYDYGKPKRVKRNRALLNLAGVALGFIQMPGWLKSNVDNFIKSFYVRQVRMEGALIGYFESTGDVGMIDRIYGQRENFYIVK
jgi:hypothetical protein